MDMASVEGVSAIQAAMIQQQINMAVLSRTMDVANAQGQAAIELLEGAAEAIELSQSSDSRQLDVRV